MLILVFVVFLGCILNSFQLTIKESNKISDSYLNAMILKGEMRKDYERMQRYVYMYLSSEDEAVHTELVEKIEEGQKTLVDELAVLKDYLGEESENYIKGMTNSLGNYIEKAEAGSSASRVLITGSAEVWSRGIPICEEWDALENNGKGIEASG